jgi:hypothetical protein
MGTTERFDFSAFDQGQAGNSEFGKAHGPASIFARNCRRRRAT